MRRLLHTPLALLVRRIVVLYVVLLLCRVLFYLCNRAQLGPIGWGEVWLLLGGALSFDTASIVYADGIFILLSLLPFEFVCRRRYQQVLYWYYVVVNFLLIVVVNLADIVYFRYTQKRFTADEFFFADNDNSLSLLFRFMGENWPLLLAGIALTGLLAGLYGRRDRCESILRPGWSHYTFSTLLFALAAGLCLAGARGGFTRATRPITLSNAMLYTGDPGKANLILSNPFCILRTIGHTEKVRYRHDFPAGELERLFTPEHRPLPDSLRAAAPQPADTLHAALKGRNVMIFILESMSAEHSAHLRPDLYAECAEKGFTPFLDSLMRSGLTLRRMYANGTRSIQAMPSVLGSIPSFTVCYSHL
ncbi:MAG: LTA synthase family protein, partial [Alistipes sp.]|nr:LTA synthase family protein [Alistipes sp.]